MWDGKTCLLYSGVCVAVVVKPQLAAEHHAAAHSSLLGWGKNQKSESMKVAKDAFHASVKYQLKLTSLVHFMLL